MQDEQNVFQLFLDKVSSIVLEHIETKTEKDTKKKEQFDKRRQKNEE